MPKLTRRFVESIKLHPTKPITTWDSELKGFGVVVLPSGRTTYVIQYRNAAHYQKRLKLGVHGSITAEEARELAKKHFASVAQGIDPVAEKKTVRNLSTFNDLVTDYLERHGQKKRPKSLLEDQKLLKNIIIPALQGRKVAHITRRDIENLHLRHENTPYQANRMLSLLSKMFSLAVSWGWRSDNPVLGIPKYQEEKRDRWLDDEELQRLWGILDQYPQNLTAYVFKFLLLTGSRKGEALQATWDQFDLEKGIWTKPSHITKQKKKEHLPLSDKTMELLHILKNLPPILSTEPSKYLFPGRIKDEPLKEIKTFWHSIIKKANLENVRIHDLRHTHASHLVSSGLSLSIVGKLLGHTQASTTQRYAHLADEPLRKATEVFGTKVGNFNTNSGS
jgi:integrase